MIITSCTNTECNEPIFYPYETGEEPYGNVFDRQICKKCGVANYIQRISFGGETLNEEQAKERGLTRNNKAN